ncbi:MAG: hypothetical protein JSS80_00985 [Bacteroidetes bacterium]|nr:hypothetical protein [Bacteroidota bacterium]
MSRVELSQKYILSDEPFVDSKVSSAFNIFWLGFIIYSSAYSIFRAPPYNIFWNKVQLVGLVIMVLSSLFLVRLRIENTYLRILYVLYFAWLSFVVARGIQFNYQFLSLSLYEAWFGIMPYFVPVVLFLPRNPAYLKKVFSVIVILGVIYLGCCLLYRDVLLAGYEEDTVRNQYTMEYFARNLSIPAGFLLISYPYQSRVRKIFALVIIGVTLLLALIRARRALVFMELSYLISFYFIYLSRSKARAQTIFFSFIFIGVLIFGGIKLYDKYKGTAFEFITERADEDTRTGVEDCLYADMTTRDWIIGKGMTGEYYCPGIDDGFFTEFRDMIETDYLNIILKGGIVSLALLLLILIPAVVKGIFYSKNFISKAAGLWILLWLMDLYPIVVTTFSLHYILVWICVGICYSREIRNLPEEKIVEMLSLRKAKTTFSI